MYILPMGASSMGTGMETKAVFDSYKNAKIEYMEVSSRPHEYEQYDWDEVKKNSVAAGVKIWSVHTPFHPDTHNIANPDEKIRKATIACYIDIFNRAAFLGAKYVIVHPSSEPISDAERPLAIQHSKESLKILAAEAKKAGVTIAVENLPRTCLGNTAEELADIISVDENLAVCFDVNHLLLQSHKHFTAVLGEKIKTLHISDYDFKDERHLLCGKGDIDWKELLELLENINYNGVFMYEVGICDENDGGNLPTRTEARENYNAVMERKL